MSTLFSLALLILFLLGGFVAVRLRALRDGPIVGRLFSFALYLLLLSMGLRLGQSREVLADLPVIGFLACAGTLAACAGTVLLHLACTPLYRRLDVSARDAGGAVARGTYPPSRRLAMLLHNLRKPLVLLVLVVLGTAIGYVLPQMTLLKDGSVATWLLWLLLFIIGIQMASGGLPIRELLLRPAVLLVPAVTIVGTLAGSLVLTLLDGMTVGRSLALVSGFGWYSLSGVLISDLGDPQLGAAAFLSNLFRETVAFLTIPLLVVTGRRESGIGIAGATSMDVTLPVIEDTWGPRSVPLAVAHGAILSLLVPFLVPLFMSF